MQKLVLGNRGGNFKLFSWAEIPLLDTILKRQ